jgi:hypothetical protein
MPVLKCKMIVVELRGNTYRVTDKGYAGFDYEMLIDGKFTSISINTDKNIPFSADDKYQIEMLFDL